MAKSRILVRLPIVYRGKELNLCDKACPHLRFLEKEKKYFCRFFGELVANGDNIYRDESCIRAEDADYHFDMLFQKIV